jgi:hypothetical protein
MVENTERKGAPPASISVRAFRKAFFIPLIAGFLAPLVHAQEIQIRVLNGRSGKPVANECLNVWTGTWRDAHLVAETDKDGVAVLRVSQTEIVAEKSCPGWPAQASRRSGLEGMMISGDRYIACQEYAKIVPGEPPTNPLTTMPSYPISKILDSGISAANKCGKFREEPKPGKLIFFVRPRSFWEKMRQ